MIEIYKPKYRVFDETLGFTVFVEDESYTKKSVKTLKNLRNLLTLF